MRLLGLFALLPTSAAAALIVLPQVGVSLFDPSIGKPPVATEVESVVAVHGDRLVDPYAWLQDPSDPDVLAYLKAENDYTEAVLAPIEGLEDILFAEMTARIVEDDQTWPNRFGDYWYQWRITGGQEHWNLVRHTGGPDGPSELVLDINALASDHNYFVIQGWSVSRDGRWLAYLEDTTGGLDYAVRMVDLESNAGIDQPIPGVSSIVWDTRGEALYYVANDESARGYQVRRHPRGGEGPDQVIYTERDPEFEVSLARTADQRFVVISTESSDTSEMHFIDPFAPDEPPILLLKRTPGIQYGATSAGGQVLMRINDTGPNYRAVTATLAEIRAGVRPVDFTVEMPEQADATLTGGVIFARHIVLDYRRDNRSELLIIDRATGASRPITFDEAAYSLGYDVPLDYDSDIFYYNIESPVTPWTTYALDLATGESTIVQSDPMPAGFDPANYETRRIAAAAADGTQIPVTLAMRRDIARDGSAPLLLEAYGAYGAAYDPYFDRTMLSLLDRGVIYAYAHVRGGGEFGDAWYDGGRLENKMNTFTDVIAVAEHLVAEGYSATDRMALMGISAGGLTVGAVINQRPDLFQVALLTVPFVDVLTAMMDPTLPLTTIEYPEWGDPGVAEEYGWMRAYDPYPNLSAQDYPDMLVVAGLTDEQVPYWQPAKYVARLRTLIGAESLVLLATDMDSGHGGDSGRYQGYRRWAMEYAFLLGALGIGE